MTCCGKLQARRRALTPRELDRALLARQGLLERADVAIPDALEVRSVVQGTLLRSTIHLVSRADYRPLATAIGPARRASWLRATKGPREAAMEAAADRLRAAGH